MDNHLLVDFNFKVPVNPIELKKRIKMKFLPQHIGMFKMMENQRSFLKV